MITGAAAAVWVGDLAAIGAPIGIAVPAARRLSPRSGVQVVRGTVDQRDITSHNGILITKSCRTAVDLAAGGCNDLLHRMAQGGGLRPGADLVIQGRTFRPDLTFDDVKLIVEIDGFAFHSDRDAFERDRQRQNALTAAGWTVLRFTWRQVRDNPAAVVAQIEQARAMLRMKLRVD